MLFLVGKNDIPGKPKCDSRQANMLFLATKGVVISTSSGCDKYVPAENPTFEL